MSASVIERSALVPYSPAQMFDLVDAVERYPDWFGWCDGVAVRLREPGQLVARLDLKLAGIRQSFTTRNTLDRPGHMELALVDGPFKALGGQWRFVDLSGQGCKVALSLRFEVDNRLLGSAFRLGFTALADRLVDDFCAQARRLYK